MPLSLLYAIKPAPAELLPPAIHILPVQTTALHFAENVELPPKPLQEIPSRLRITRLELPSEPAIQYNPFHPNARGVGVPPNTLEEMPVHTTPSILYAIELLSV